MPERMGECELLMEYRLVHGQSAWMDIRMLKCITASVEKASIIVIMIKIIITTIIITSATY